MYKHTIDQTFTWVDVSKNLANARTIEKKYFLGIKYRTIESSVTHDMGSNKEEKKLGFGIHKD